MGYTHFDKVVGVKGTFFGAKGSEAIMPVALTVTQREGTAGAGAGVADTQYVAAPISGDVSGYVMSTATDGSARVVTGTLGSAGAILVTSPTAFVTSTGTVGEAFAMTNSSGTTTVTKGQSISVAFAAEDTAQLQSCTLLFTPSTA